MRCFCYSLVFLSLVFLHQSAVPVQTQAKRALLIGVSDYKQSKGKNQFVDLNADEDVKAIKSALVERFQFTEKEIKTLTSKAETSRESILRSFREFIIEATQPGDIVFIYYSGHGSQVPDASESDGLAETLVPSDYADDGSKDIRDKEIKGLLIQLKGRKPSTVFLGFDSCHSGTAFRAEVAPYSKVRGMSWEDRFGQRSKPKPGPSQTMTKLAGEKALGEGFVVFSSCQDNQLSIQEPFDNGKPIGRLSHFLSKALISSEPDSTYRDIFETIEAQMAQHCPGQIPNIEGDQDYLLLKGTAVPSEKYIPVFVTAEENKKKIRAGSLLGMTTDSKLAIYPAGTKEFTENNKIAEATIVDVQTTESEIQITKKIKPDFQTNEFLAARAVETLHNYNNNGLRLDLQDFRILPDADKVISTLREMEAKDKIVNLKFAPGRQPDLRMVLISREELSAGIARPSNASVGPRDVPALIRTDDGSVIEALTTAEDHAQKVRNILLRESKYRSVRLLENRSQKTGVQVEMRIIPATVVSENNSDLFKNDLPIQFGNKVFQDGDWFTIEVRNTGDKDAYITVLDLPSNGKPAQLWPAPDHEIDNLLRKEQKTWIKLWTSSVKIPQPVKITPPAGPEIFKLVATNSKVDFSGLSRRGPQNPMEEVLNAAWAGTRSRSDAVPTDWCTATVVVTVRNK